MSLLDLFQPDSDGDALAEAGARWLTQAYVADATGFSVPMWSQMAASGWTALRLPEACGGLDLGLSSCLPLVAELGAAGVREPIVESALIAAPLAARAAADADFLGGLAEGHRLCVLIDDPSLPVPGGNEITDLLIYDAERAELTLCPASAAPGAVWLSMDGRRMADRPRPQSGTVLLSGDAAHQAVALARAERRACLATEGCGAMQRALGLTARYLSERQQFGQPLAQFQALQHRLADMLVELELTRSAAAILTAHDTPPALRDSALAQITRALRRVGEAAVQLHGGMGMTADMEIGGVFKRMLHLASALGGETAPRGRLTRALAARIEQEHRP